MASTLNNNILHVHVHVIVHVMYILYINVQKIKKSTNIVINPIYNSTYISIKCSKQPLGERNYYTL